MSKVKSAIITSLVVIAIIVAAVFGVASYNIGAAGRYNSIAANIPLGSEFTGYVYTTAYPEGVIPADRYVALTEEEQSSYEAHGGLYVNLGDSGYDTVEELESAVAGDAKIISSRFAARGLADYSVTVTDGLAITAAVPSGLTYAAYTGNSSVDRSNALNAASTTLGYLLADGELTLRTSDASITLGSDDEDDSSGSAVDMTRFEDEYTDADVLGDGSKTYSFVSVNEDVTEYFNSVSSFTFGGAHVVNFSLTQTGRERINYISTLAASSSSQTIYVCVGSTRLLAITCTSTIDSDTLQFTMETASAASDVATALNSVVNGGKLSADYADIESALATSAAGGDLAAVLALVSFVVVLLVLCVCAAIKYKKLGGVLSMSLAILSLVLLYALFILGIQVSYSVVATCGLVLVLFAAANLVVLGEVRAQCAKGKTMQAAVKDAYKRTLLPVLDIHIVILVLAIFVASVTHGAVAASGLILVVGAIASYAIYWFTRLMWFVLSAPQRNKFAFGGFKREVYGDDE